MVAYKRVVRVFVSISSISVWLHLYAAPALALSEADFQTFGRRYGVSPQLLRAISIIETREGKITGEHEVRKVVNNTQLKFLRKISKYSGRSLAELKGSSAGAMGYMQIMPSTFHYYGQDGNGDGIKDPLNDYDNIATAAYFLARTIGVTQNLRNALYRYNNSDIYCDQVLMVYWELEYGTSFANLLKHSQNHIP